MSGWVIWTKVHTDKDGHEVEIKTAVPCTCRPTHKTVGPSSVRRALSADAKQKAAGE
jgi:hypothetical protein